MEVFGPTIEIFLRRVRTMAREILSQEVGLKLHRTRFEWNQKLYPLHLVIFDHSSKLGEYDPSQWRLGLSSRLMKEAKDAVIRDILRHEIAHMMTHLHFGENIQAHGSEFKNICSRYGFDHEISKATLDLAMANDHYEGDLQTEKLLSRLKKLMALSESDNTHEAELAMSKANELLIKHNLDRLEIDHDDELVYVLPVMFSPKSNAKMHAVYEILKTFFVAPVFTKRQGQVALDVVGDQASVKIAEYVSAFLQDELERLWGKAKKTNNLKGLRAKNSFFSGVARGYVEKIQTTQKEFHQSALMKVQSSSQKMLARVYGRLSSTSSSSKADSNALHAGSLAGKQMNIRTGIEKSGNQGRLLSYDS